MTRQRSAVAARSRLTDTQDTRLKKASKLRYWTAGNPISGVDKLTCVAFAPLVPAHSSQQVEASRHKLGHLPLPCLPACQRSHTTNLPTPHTSLFPLHSHAPSPSPSRTVCPSRDRFLSRARSFTCCQHLSSFSFVVAFFRRLLYRRLLFRRPLQSSPSRHHPLSSSPSFVVILSRRHPLASSFPLVVIPSRRRPFSFASLSPSSSFAFIFFRPHPLSPSSKFHTLRILFSLAHS